MGRASWTCATYVGLSIASRLHHFAVRLIRGRSVEELRHIRDPHSLRRLAREIVRRMDRGNSIWNKWDGQREVLLKSAVECWVAIGESLIEALGGLLIFDPSAIDDYAVLAGIRCFVAELVFVTV